MWEFIQSFMNPEHILHVGGLALVLVILFAENGILIGFFLPGDSLLFFAGLFVASKPEVLGLNVFELIVYMILSALAGCLFGYYFGWRVGPSIFKRKETWWFKHKYIEATRSYYSRHGAKTLVIGKFLPYIRTFAPILSGIIRVPFLSFLISNLIGAVAWVTSLTLCGYYLGVRFPGVKDYIEIIIIGFVVVANGLVFRTYLKERKKSHAKASEAQE